MASPLLVAHCGWGAAPEARWMAVARTTDGGAQVEAPEPVGDPSTLLDRLCARAAGAGVLVGFPFPIGLPRAYAAQVGVDRFRPFLRALGGAPSFFEIATTPEQISLARPFYPATSAGSQRAHQVAALGVGAYADLLRRCEGPTALRRAGSPLFWLVGAQQAGRSAISGWRDVLVPALAEGVDLGLWPFDGALSDLLARHQVVVAETSPEEFLGHLAVQPGKGGKRSRSGREPASVALVERATAMGLGLSQGARSSLGEAFGSRGDGEARFDAFVGLIGMLGVVLGHRAPGPPATVSAEDLAVEGWILGQD